MIPPPTITIFLGEVFDFFEDEDIAAICSCEILDYEGVVLWVCQPMGNGELSWIPTVP